MSLGASTQVVLHPKTSEWFERCVGCAALVLTVCLWRDRCLQEASSVEVSDSLLEACGGRLRGEITSRCGSMVLR